MLLYLGRTLFIDMIFCLWLVAIALITAGTILARRARRRLLGTAPASVNAHLPPISILKPLKGLDDGIEENLEGFFNLNYPSFELLFSVSESTDEAISLVQRLMAKYPLVEARLVVGDVKVGINPKVNNLVRPYAMARHDWALISDSNTRVDPNFLRRMAAQLTDGVALQFCVVAGEGPLSLGGRLDAVSLNTVYARGILLAASANFPCVTGKAMLLRRSVLDQFGGIRAFGPEVAEDFVIGQAFQRMGHKVIVSLDPIQQHVGYCSIAAYWSRTIRWGRIRKIHAPRIVFMLEPLLTSVGSGVLGAVAFHSYFHVSPLLFFPLHMSFWWSCDWLLMRSLGQKFSWSIVAAWAAREFLHLIQWLHISVGNSVEWRGSVLKMERTGTLDRLCTDSSIQV